MKNYRVKRLMTPAVILLAGLCFAVSSYAREDNSQEKIRLLAAVVEAKESGNFAAAKENLEALLKIVPADKAVQNLLIDVNKSIEDASTEYEARKLLPPELSALEAEAEGDLFYQTIKKQDMTVLAVYALLEEAEDFIDDENLVEAKATLDVANKKLSYFPSDSEALDDVRADLNKLYATVAKMNAESALAAGQFADAEVFAEDFADKTENQKAAEKLLNKIERYSENPYKNTLASVSPDYVARQKEVDGLVKKGKIQYLYGDYDGARRTFRSIETLDNQNLLAKTYLSLISQKISEVGAKSYEATRKQMIAEIDNIWQLPQVYSGDSISEDIGAVVSPIALKMEEIIIPEVNFNEVPLSRVINTLSVLSMEYDKSDIGIKGVNIVPLEKDDSSTVSLTLRNAPLGQILYLATRQIGYTYDIQENVVVVVKGSADASILNVDTEYFSVPQTALENRILGIKKASAGDSSDPFASGGSSGSGGDMDSDAKNEVLLKFFTSKGVSFGAGTSVSLEDSGISVTNTPTNIERVRNILQRYSDVEQVEVEAKFMEVNQGALNMLAFNYGMARGDEVLFQTNNRLLSATIAQTNAGETDTTITSPIYETVGGVSSISGYDTEPYPQSIPSLPSSINLASAAADTASAVLGVINGFKAEIVVNALSQEQGTDLLTAPRLTVVSGETANINVSQVMFYPTSFTDVQSDVGSDNGNGNSDNSSAGVTITPGTPSDFQEVNIGITMEITPTVQEDKSILIDLNPVIREFEGFMEYGGLAVAISSGTTVTVPSGFIQPVFSIREIKTQVYVFDGATIVLGGLVREEVKTVNDGVPFFKDIPLIGTFFRSKGEARQKKNLLIFVTANRITPGGSLRNALFSGVSSSSIYQNPVVRSPGGVITRVGDLEEAPEATK